MASSDDEGLAEGMKQKVKISSEDVECWICLQEGSNNDDDGQSLIRDCSCRGSMGFAHFNCIVEYAKTKSNQNHSNIVKFTQTWEVCPNCKQNYLNQLRLDLANEIIQFTKEIFPLHPQVSIADFPCGCDPYRYCEALYVKTRALANLNADDEEKESEICEEGKAVALEIISVIDKMRIFTPTFPKQITQLLGLAYNQLGHFIMNSIAPDSSDKVETRMAAIKYFEKARELFLSIGEKDNADIATSQIETTKLMMGGTKSTTKASNIKHLKDKYKQNPNAEVGMSLIFAYLHEKRFIESQHTLAELVCISRQLHGIDHEETQSLISMLEQIKSAAKKQQVVELLSSGKRGPGNQYIALRYTEDGTKCIVNGPISTKESDDKEENTVEVEDLFFTVGTGVVCHDLVNASHLNGQAGEVRSFDEEKQRYRIFFEDVNLKACLVKPTNLRIQF